MSPTQLSRLFLTAAYALFALFVIATLVDAMPPALLDSGWIVTTAASLVNFVTLPLVGLLFVHLAAYFTPSPTYQAIQARTSRWAGIAALGFLLLAPLLVALVIHNSQTIAGTNAKARLQLNAQSNQLRRAVSQARNPAELQAAMVALKGPTLDNAALARPLPSLQKELIATIETTKDRYLSQLKGPYSPQNWPILKVVLRSFVQCIIAGLAFAALAWSPLTNSSLLEQLTSKSASGEHQRPSMIDRANKLLARVRARLEFSSRRNERRALAEMEKKRRNEVKRKIRQEMNDRQKQLRLFAQNAEKNRQRLGQQSRRDPEGSETDSGHRS